MENDVRWKQRFQNLEKSLLLLEEALSLQQPDIFQKAGMIQFFEISFELAWNTMKDFMEGQGLTELRTPRDTIKKAFEIGLLQDGHLWLETLQNRNLTAHTYDEATAEKVVAEIRKIYFPLLKNAYLFFKDQL